MANLNFEQPPRSIANASLTSRAGGGGGLNSSTLTGHVTPTSGMFSGSSASTSSSANSAVVATNVYPGASGTGGGQNSHQPQQQQLSPMGSRGLFGQRAFTDRRTMPAVGGGGGDTSTPPLLDLSEFPSLTNRGQGDSMPQPSPMPGKQPYVGMVKQPTSESSEFTMSSEDFPALPGTQNREGPSPGGSVSGDKSIPVGLGPEIGQDVLQANRAPGSEKSQSSKRGIQTSPDGKVTNIPLSMVKDQFGMVGLLTFIRAAETDPNLVSLALGQDLTALGLNLNSPENLYQNFGGPWAETPCRPQDIDFHVPPEYLINASIRDKLAPVKLNRYKDDLLFYMFYTNVGDVLQLAAAAELYSREWRYHMEEKVWITQAPGLGLVEKTSTYERGTYYYFDAQSWRKVAKEFYLDYTKLESRPHLPTNFHQILP
ncbi:CCR4-NOT transcription complex subunit regena isoform X2 [Calliopsis andreniformis]|uniref:CCR4-NOT transcription complex subunit regena isoform X2 n=1 Tax=Calliopsis andreniformis TaxID=337506 RepID=UPI003FCD2F53